MERRLDNGAKCIAKNLLVQEVAILDYGERRQKLSLSETRVGISVIDS
jgi:hypothetical protein